MVLLATGATPSDVVPMNFRNLKIPVRLDGQKDRVKELLLFSSTDEGRTWNQAAVTTPDKDGFVFVAPADGVYWFNVVVVDQQGNRSPKDIYNRPPDQKILIDTVKPTIRIVSAERVQDEVLLSWDIDEDHPDLTTFKVEYRAADAPNWNWTPAAVTSGLKGQGRFRCTTSGPVVVRMQLTDLAGNLGSDEKEAKAAPPAAPPSVPVTPVATQTNPMTSTFPGAATTPTWNQPNPAWTGVGQTPVQPVAMTTGQYVPPTAPWIPQQVPAAPQDAYNGMNGFSSTSAYGGQGIVPRWPNGIVLPLQITKSTRVSLDYQVTNDGPSGIGSVELYLTRDDGRNWQRYTTNPTLRPPMIVNLPGEGVYGLRILVKSGAGLGKRPPQPGDLPQMRIEVDTTPPLVKMLYPQMDPNRRDTLLLAWTASDRNLAPSPITLQYAERARGPWNTIASDLANTGRYTWQLSPAVPYKVYLRVTAQDTAGNIGEDITPEAVLVDLHEPEAQLIGISPNNQ
jgi:hypothetical protein